MDHETVIAIHAVERYLLADMPAADRDAFEEHFFDCPECAQAVRSGLAFVSGVKAVITTERQSDPVQRAAIPPARFAWRWQAWAPSLAGVLLLLVAAYPHFVRGPSLERRLEQAAAWRQAPAPAAVLVPDIRGPFTPVPYQVGSLLRLRLDIPPTLPPGTYDARISNEDGREVGVTPLSIAAGADSAEIFCSDPDLHPGRYTVELKARNTAATTAAVASYRFELNVRPGSER